MTEQKNLLFLTMPVGPIGKSPVYCTVEVADSLSCQCPVNGDDDEAIVTVTYEPRDLSIEFDSWHAYVQTFRGRAISHEEVTAELYRAIEDHIHPRKLSVVTQWVIRNGMLTKVEVNG